MRNNLRHLAKIEDPDEAKQRMLAELGDLDAIELFTNRVMCATYITPDRVGSIFLPDKTVEESRFQAKVGLVVKKGPLAFVDDANTKFGGDSIEIGDWVWYRTSDGMEVQIGKSFCRVIPDVLIIGRVKSPEQVW